MSGPTMVTVADEFCEICRGTGVVARMSSRKVRLVDPECTECNGTGIVIRRVMNPRNVKELGDIRDNCRCVEFMNPQSLTRDVHHHYGDRGDCA